MQAQWLTSVLSHVESVILDFSSTHNCWFPRRLSYSVITFINLGMGIHNREFLHRLQCPEERLIIFYKYFSLFLKLAITATWHRAAGIVRSQSCYLRWIQWCDKVWWNQLFRYNPLSFSWSTALGQMIMLDPMGRGTIDKSTRLWEWCIVGWKYKRAQKPTCKLAHTNERSSAHSHFSRSSGCAQGSKMAINNHYTTKQNLI